VVVDQITCGSRHVVERRMLWLWLLHEGGILRGRTRAGSDTLRLSTGPI
jgi:hypothetical protein